MTISISEFGRDVELDRKGEKGYLGLSAPNTNAINDLS
jgi:hypothetical protein